MALTIADILTRDVVTVSPQTLVSESAALMAEHKFSCLIIVDQKKVVGILSESDLVRAGSLQVDIDHTAVGDFISQPPITVATDLTVYEAFDFLIEHHIRHLVAVSPDGELEGLVTFTDIIKSVSFDDYLKAKLVVDEMSKIVASVDADATVLDAVSMMNRQRISCVIVLRDNRPEGIFTERDAAKMVASYCHLESVRVVDVMTTPLKTLPLSTSLLEASDAMRSAGIRRMVIVDSAGFAAGILTQFDVIRGLEAQRVRHFRKLHASTEERLAESQRLLAEKLELQRIVDASPAILYRCERTDDDMFVGTYVSQAMTAQLGYDSQECLQPDWWLSHMHPDDRHAAVVQQVQLIEQGEIEHVYRFSSKSGEWYWIRDHARLLKGGDGKPDEIVGSWLDVTEAHNSEEKYRTMVESVNDAIFVADMESGILIDANEQAEKLLGLAREKIIGMHQTKLHPPEEMARYAKIFADHAGNERSFIPDLLVRRGDGTDVPVDISTHKAEIGGKTVLQGVFRDISERKQADERLRLAQFALDQAADAIYWMTNEGRFIYVNEAATRMLGYSRDELLDMGVEDIDPSLPDGVTPEMVQATKEHGFGRVETSHRTKDGRLVPVEVMVGYFEFGDQEYHCSFVRDISERQHHQIALEQSEARYRGLVDNLKEVVFQTDAEGKWLYLNQAWQEVTGFSVEESAGKLFLDYVYPEDRELNMERFKPLIERQKDSCRHEIRYRHKDGGYRWIEVFARLTLDEQNQVTGTTGMLTDITERKSNEQEVKQAAERMQRILDADFDAIIVHQDEKVVFSNKQAQQMFGYATLKETIGEDVMLYFIPEIRSFAAGIGRRAIRTGKPVGRFETMALSRARNEPFPIEIASTPIQWAGKPALVSIVRDITASKLAGKLLEVERSSMRALLNNLPFLAWLKDDESTYLAVNENYAKACGADDPETLVGKTDLDIWPEDLANAYRFDDRDVMDGGESRQIEELVEVHGERHWFETFKSPVFDDEGKVIGTAGITRDITDRLISEQQMRLLESAVAAVNESIIITNAQGIIEYVNPGFTRNTGYAVEDAIGNTPAILNSKQQSQGFYEQFWKTIKGGSSWSGRILDRKKNGTIFPVYLSVAPIVAKNGEITHFVAVHEDLTEAEALQKKMMMSQKMEAVGTMVGGVAHDFNNLLASIVGNLYLMRKRFQDDEKTVSRIKGMESSVQHGAQLIQQMLTFARKDRTEMHAMDLAGFIKEAYKLAHAGIPENISFRLDYAPGEDFWIKGDATQLQQVLLNLVTNARHAVKDSEKPEIEMKLEIVAPDALMRARFAEMADESEWCCLSCSDNGCGMNHQLVERIFEPFFTTKTVGEGTGLGLAMVYGAVQNHKGIIDVQSVPGEGTRFSVYLPLHKTQAARVVSQDDAEVDGKGMTILLVDDEEGLRHVLADVLRHNSFMVLQASDGEQAVEMFEKHEADIKLVLMDVVMPNKGGVVAAREIRQINATVPIIFQTGYGEQTQLQAAASISNSDSLQKPVQVPVLMKLILSKIDGCNEL